MKWSTQSNYIRIELLKLSYLVSMHVDGDFCSELRSLGMFVLYKITVQACRRSSIYFYFKQYGGASRLLSRTNRSVDMVRYSKRNATHALDVSNRYLLDSFCGYVCEVIRMVRVNIQIWNHKKSFQLIFYH